MAFKMLSGTLRGPSEEVSLQPLKEKSEQGNVLKFGSDVLPESGEFSDKRAKYKIEVAYLESRKTKAPSACSVTVWESGKRFHGGGDQSMFWCLNSKNYNEGCGGLIPDSMVKEGVALCPHCKRSVNQQFLPVTRVGVFSPANLAIEIHKLFRHLGSDADIYLKFHKSDAEARARLKSEGGAKKELAIYTVSRLIQDSLNGSDLAKRIETFLTA